MADPTKYTPHFNYSGWEAAGNKRPKPGAELDIDFANIARSVDETIDALKDIRRSDGKLKNGIVDMDAMEPGLKADFQGYKDDAETARDQAQQARTAAQNAQGAAEGARDQAQSAETGAKDARDAAVSAADRAGFSFNSVAEVQGSRIPPIIEAVRTNGYYSPGDGMGSLYVRVANEPDHWGKVQSADGQWWEKASRDEGTFALADYLHPQDLFAARQGDTSSQDEARVTAAVQSFHDRVMAWWAAENGRVASVVYPQAATLAINDEIFSEDFADTLWSFPHSNSKFHIQPQGCTFQAKNWTGRSAIRTSGLYAEQDIAYAVPKAMFRWERRSAGGQVPIITGGALVFRGEGSVARDPIGVKMLSGTSAFLNNVQVYNLQNTQCLLENLFNGSVNDMVLQTGGYQPTEFGGSGFIPNSVRFSNSGAVVTASAPVFSPEHQGRWFGLNNAGDVWQTFIRAVHLSTIASVDSDTQITLTDAPAVNVSGVTGTFAAIRGSIASGSNTLTLSADITDDLTGRYITIVGAGIEGAKPRAGLLTAVVTSHSGNTVTLSATARYTVSNAPIVVNPQLYIGHTAESLSYNSSLGRLDDVTFGNIQVETGDWRNASVPVVWAGSSTTDFSAGSKFHAATTTRNNFGASFCTLVLDDVSGKLDGNLTHGGFDPDFGIVIATGDRVSVNLNASLTDYPTSTRRAVFYLAPTTVSADIRLFSRLSPAQPRIADQVYTRLGANATSDMVMSYFSARAPGNDYSDTEQTPVTRFGKVVVKDFEFDGDDYGVYGWGASGSLPIVVDADTILTSGLYACNDSSANVPAWFGMLEVFTRGGTKIQRFTRTGATLPGFTWTRQRLQGVWTPWQAFQLVHAGDTPASGGAVGSCYFHTSLGKPVWWDGTQWVDATGAAI